MHVRIACSQAVAGLVVFGYGNEGRSLATIRNQCTRVGLAQG